jgi:hypothetical protein
LAKFSKIIIMLVRLIALIELGLGAAIFMGKALPYLKLHIGLGFTMSFLLILLSGMAALKHLTVPVLAGTITAFLLPYIGLKQLPINFGRAISPMQYAHVFIALATIGAAEYINAEIRKAPSIVTVTYRD